VVTSPPISTPAPRTPLPATPSSSPKVWTSSGSLHRSAVSAVPRQRHESVPAAPRTKTTTLVDRARKPKRIGPDDSSKKGVAALIAGKCDELFPPSRPAFRLRNQVCHQIYG
jgi:hypothetical protein